MIENGILKPNGVIQLRGGTYTDLSLINPVLVKREIMIETDTGRLKVGDGVHRWNELKYLNEIGHLVNPTLTLNFDSSVDIVRNTANQEIVITTDSDGVIDVSSSDDSIVTISKSDSRYYLSTTNILGTAKITVSIEGTDSYTPVRKSFTVNNVKLTPTLTLNYDGTVNVTPNTTNKEIVITTNSDGAVTVTSSKSYYVGISQVNSRYYFSSTSDCGTSTITVSIEGTDTYVPISKSFVVKNANIPTITISPTSARVSKTAGQQNFTVSVDSMGDISLSYDINNSLIQVLPMQDQMPDPWGGTNATTFYYQPSGTGATGSITIMACVAATSSKHYAEKDFTITII